MKKLDICKIKTCSRKIRVKKHGLCGAHLRRFMKNGDVMAEKKIRKYVKVEPFVIEN